MKRKIHWGDPSSSSLVCPLTSPASHVPEAPQHGSGGVQLEAEGGGHMLLVCPPPPPNCSHPCVCQKPTMTLSCWKPATEFPHVFSQIFFENKSIPCGTSSWVSAWRLSFGLLSSWWSWHLEKWALRRWTFCKYSQLFINLTDTVSVPFFFFFFFIAGRESGPAPKKLRTSSHLLRVYHV